MINNLCIINNKFIYVDTNVDFRGINLMLNKFI